MVCRSVWSLYIYIIPTYCMVCRSVWSIYIYIRSLSGGQINVPVWWLCLRLFQLPTSVSGGQTSRSSLVALSSAVSAANLCVWRADILSSLVALSSAVSAANLCSGGPTYSLVWWLCLRLFQLPTSVSGGQTYFLVWWPSLYQFLQPASVA